MTTLFKHKKTGARVKIISELDNGDCFMVEDQDSRTFYAYKHELETDPEGTKKVKTLQIKDKASKEEPRDFPPETRLNIILFLEESHEVLLLMPCLLSVMFLLF